MRTSPTGNASYDVAQVFAATGYPAGGTDGVSCSHHRLHRGDPYRLSGVVGGPGLEAAGSLILDPADCMTSLPSGATPAIVPNSLQSLLPYGIQASSPSMKVRKKDG